MGRVLQRRCSPMAAVPPATRVGGIAVVRMNAGDEARLVAALMLIGVVVPFTPVVHGHVGHSSSFEVRSAAELPTKENGARTRSIRQREEEFCSTAWLSLGPDAATVTRDDPLDGGEPDSRPINSLEEWKRWNGANSRPT